MSELHCEMGNDVSALVGGDERETNHSKAATAAEKASGLQRDLHPTVLTLVNELKLKAAAAVAQNKELSTLVLKIADESEAKFDRLDARLDNLETSLRALATKHQVELLAKELARTTVLAQETLQHASAHHAACVSTAKALAEHVGGGAAPKPLQVAHANGARRPRAGSGAATLATPSMPSDGPVALSASTAFTASSASTSAEP